MKLVVLSLVIAAVAAPRPVTESAASGDVRATFTYTATDDGQFKDLKLVIERAGSTALEYLPKPVCQSCATWPGGQGNGSSRSSSVRVADLDRDGEPVVMLDLYTGGAHCCLYTVFFRFDGSGYVQTHHNWNNETYRFTDLGRDGVPEFVTRDDRFNYAFSCYACSGRPLRVLRVVNRKLVDVTRSFPALVRHDAALWWHSYRTAARHHEDVSGLLPAYVADESLLGHRRAAWTRIRRVVTGPAFRRTVTDPRWKSGQRYLASVHAFLRKTGYLR